MKTIVAVAIVAFSAVLQIIFVSGSLSTQLETINKQINEVQELTDSMREMQYVDIFPRVLSLITGGRENVSLYMESELSETFAHFEESVRNSTAAGKDATGCNTTAVSKLRDLEPDVIRTFDICFDIAREWLNSTEETIEANTRQATYIFSYLNMIFSSCYVTDTEDIESCVVQMQPNATQLVDTFKTTMISFMLEIGEFRAVNDRMVDCIDAGDLVVKERWDTIEQDFDKCVTAL